MTIDFGMVFLWQLLKNGEARMLTELTLGCPRVSGPDPSMTRSILERARTGMMNFDAKRSSGTRR